MAEKIVTMSLSEYEHLLAKSTQPRYDFKVYGVPVTEFQYAQFGHVLNLQLPVPGSQTPDAVHEAIADMARDGYNAQEADARTIKQVLEAELRSMTKERDILQQHLRESAASLGKMIAERDEIKKHLSEAVNRSLERALELTEVRSERDTAESELRGVREQLVGLQNAVEGVNREAAQARESLAHTKKLLQDLRQNYEQAVNELEDGRANIKTLRKLNEHQRDNITALNKLISELPNSETMQKIKRLLQI